MSTMMPSRSPAAPLALGLLLLTGCGGAARQVPHPATPTAAAPDQAPNPGDPLVHVVTRYPQQRFLTARGEGPTAAAARDTAQRLLLETIQSRVRAVTIDPAACNEPGCADQGSFSAGLVREVPPFKHAALIRQEGPFPHAGGFVALATLRRDEVAPFVEEETRVAREKLEAWRREMRLALETKAASRVLERCAEGPGRLLKDLEQARLTLAVIQSDATSYTASDDLKSVLGLRHQAKALLGGTPTTVVLVGDGGDAKNAPRVANLVLQQVVEQGLQAQLAAKAGSQGLVILVRPEITWTQDGFHFLRTGVDLEARFAGTAEAFLKVNVEGNRTKAGGVKPEHALRDSLKLLEKILAQEFKPKLPDLACQAALD